MFQLTFPSNIQGRDRLHREHFSLELPISDSELEQLGERMRIPKIPDVTTYHVRSRISYLPDYLPPGCTVGELNQVARTIWEVCNREDMSRKKLLASLEAEAPREIDAVCSVIRNHRDYAFLPMAVLEPEKYAKYMLDIHHMTIEPEMEEFYDLDQYGKQKIKENGPVHTPYGVLVNKVRPIPEIVGALREFRLYNSLALSAYWNDSDSFTPEILNGEAAIFYREMIQEKIEKSMQDCSERGLAEYLSNELLGRRVFSMVPGIEEYGGELWGVLTVKTHGELNQRELEALREEWRAMADGGWGEELFYRPIRIQRGEVYIGFWDTDNNDNLFIKTEEEFKKDCQDGNCAGQARRETIQEPSF